MKTEIAIDKALAEMKAREIIPKTFIEKEVLLWRLFLLGCYLLGLGIWICAKLAWFRLFSVKKYYELCNEIDRL